MGFMKPRLSINTVEKVEELLQQGLTYSEIVKKAKVSKSSISRIKNGTYRKAPLITEYIDEEKYNSLEKKYADLENEYTKLKDENRKLFNKIRDINNLKNLNYYINILGKYINSLPYNFKSNNNINDPYFDMNDFLPPNIINKKWSTKEILDLWLPLNLTTFDISEKLNCPELKVREVIREFNKKNKPPITGVASGKCGFTTLRAFSPLIPSVYRLFICLTAYVIL
jgi:transcriptional regulator with XRE-family HTH domain